MISMIQDLPEGVIGFEAVGEVQGSDYTNDLAPAIDAAVADGKKLRMLYLLGNQFTGYSGAAMWEDTKLGMSHLTAFEKIAVVTDTAWIGDGVKAFGWMIPGDVRVFPTADLDAAKAWVAD
jgi:hypothetical protein